MTQRIDKFLVEKNLVNSRSQAHAAIEQGLVYIELGGQSQQITKSSTKIPADAIVKMNSMPEARYVSRAGLKLELALRRLAKKEIVPSIDACAKNKQILDVGQSTGGFTDCLLKHGATSVVGVDVGHDQLHESLKNDPRVKYYEGVNARELSQKDCVQNRLFGWIVMDVSFISQTLILPELKSLLVKDGLLISLVKPQFEAGSNYIGKKGIVKDECAFEFVEQKILTCIKSLNWRCLDYFESGITGTGGNQEFFVVATPGETFSGDTVL